jgi:hypothetical protein
MKSLFELQQSFRVRKLCILHNNNLYSYFEERCMTDFDPRNILISLAPEIRASPEVVSSSGITPAKVLYGLAISVTNQGATELEWLNLDLVQWVYQYKKHKGYDSNSTTETTQGWRHLRASFQSLHAGKAQSQFIECQGHWKVCRIYGARPGHEPFIHWLSKPIAFGVTTTHKDAFCFIATAAYQDPDHPMVQQLRFVRDELLAHSRLGRRFIAAYDRHGPKAADIVRPSRTLRVASRAILTPLALTVKAARRITASIHRIRDCAS